MGAASVAMDLVYSDVPRSMDYFRAKRRMYVKQIFHRSNVRCLNRWLRNILAHPEHVRSKRFIPIAGQMPLEESQPSGKHIFCEGLSTAHLQRRGGSAGSRPAAPCRFPVELRVRGDPALPGTVLQHVAQLRKLSELSFPPGKELGAGGSLRTRGWPSPSGLCRWVPAQCGTRRLPQSPPTRRMCVSRGRKTNSQHGSPLGSHDVSGGRSRSARRSDLTQCVSAWQPGDPAGRVQGVLSYLRELKKQRRWD